MKSFTVTDVGFGGSCTKSLFKKYIKNHNIYIYIYIYFNKSKGEENIRVTKKKITNYSFIKK